ncbi:hypothetical protein BRADI_2g24435v3 [Brachypodium distachyon]|uniref:Uncharacterized protein n=1 Tax=Brachypodium distachyon TaxID=15368 RepID=I1HJ55_BRADI|nr:hypothetical protein BRADI_2g24435v3 [Brachypodium distachyon]
MVLVTTKHGDFLRINMFLKENPWIPCTDRYTDKQQFFGPSYHSCPSPPPDLETVTISNFPSF